VLDNHDDFGGHAKRNEFVVDGRLLIESPLRYNLPSRQGVLADLPGGHHGRQKAEGGGGEIHFPDGNATLARLLVRWLIPDAGRRPRRRRSSRRPARHRPMSAGG